MLKWVALGYEVHILGLTNGEPTPHGSHGIRKKAWEQATALLGVNKTVSVPICLLPKTA